jgi:phosphoglycerate dehydrogenase-like enzyme
MNEQEPIQSAPLAPGAHPAMCRAAFVNQGGKVNIDRVYDGETLRRLAQRFDFYPGVYSRADILAGSIPEAQVLFSTWGMPTLTEEELSAHLPLLKAVFYGAGSVQGFARPFLRRGVAVISAWQANSVPVIEYATAQIILANKGFFQSARLCSSQAESRSAAQAYFKHLQGNYDTPVGLIGLGAIGAGVARRLRDYRLTVYAYDPYCSPEKAEALGVHLESLPFLFFRCLTVSNHVANTPATKGMLNYTLFSLMSPYATFINTGRGAQVVEEDLIRALREEPGRTAVLDVTDPEPSPEGHPFYEMNNVFLTPHIAGSAGAECYRMGTYMLEEAERYLAGEPLRYQVTEKMLESMA